MGVSSGRREGDDSSRIDCIPRVFNDGAAGECAPSASLSVRCVQLCPSVRCRKSAIHIWHKPSLLLLLLSSAALNI
ncbi:hypothetical protein Y032_0117g664 [Ancylostoma ceylanicum]|uniref:Uncharacterized protein n=1 Tax=Ancylostoma ceylanicum TaxID=53326 RepID=A0A016TB65_9BILA|nr:hypothetical protein Y032_0117g664 [Ancylostoma ceylanicum]